MWTYLNEKTELVTAIKKAPKVFVWCAIHQFHGSWIQVKKTTVLAMLNDYREKYTNGKLDDNGNVYIG